MISPVMKSSRRNHLLGEMISWEMISSPVKSSSVGDDFGVDEIISVESSPGGDDFVGDEIISCEIIFCGR